MFFFQLHEPPLYFGKLEMKITRYVYSWCKINVIVVHEVQLRGYFQPVTTFSITEAQPAEAVMELKDVPVTGHDQNTYLLI